MMKNDSAILILNYEFPPLGGGAANATYYLLKEFARQKNLKIDLVTSSVGAYKEEQFAKNIKIYYLDIGKKDSLHYQSQKDLLVYSWKAYWFCRKLAKTNLSPYNLVHAFFGIPCGYIAMKLGLPYIVSLRGSDVPFYNKRFYWLDKLVFKRLSSKIWRKARAVIANSEDLKKLALGTSQGQEISVICNGVDTAEFQPAVRGTETVSSTFNGERPLKIISTGRLIERKGYAYLVEALEGLQGCELFLAGDGNQKDELRALAKKHGVNVKFFEGVDHKQIPGLLGDADIFVLPSLNEGMSNSMLEAMACGLPVITTDTGGSTKLINGNGFIVEKGSSNKLREAILEYLRNPELVHMHGLRSREMSDQMSWTNVANAYNDMFTQECIL